ncbi:hypothetical protein TW1_011 [Pseudoalteromonas phage TW1]|uniref:hypothetical protein n=1 Tax=Pseudoalteromonas phage TW1 TaxID=1366055 RepID=UPI00035AB6F4|nr:hypothetical protein PP585_gp11 [Pseudoalteromonas phage TW1]AGR46527.1 hypothetical protein TW1_011 [Pseudoalteromonas phage TW1]
MSRSNRGKYQSIEKILYLANQDKMLNVSVRESEGTDLNNRVNLLLDSNCLEFVKNNGEDKFYKTTKKGKVKLLKMQIKVRKEMGKPTDIHEFELEELLES